MSKYVFIYHGWGEPTDELMQDWTNWFASINGSIVDGGNPFGPGMEVKKTGVSEITSDSPITGYSIVQADSMEHAVKLLDDCPTVDSVHVYEAMSM
jgi:hypothetical protein